MLVFLIRYWNVKVSVYSDHIVTKTDRRNTRRVTITDRRNTRRVTITDRRNTWRRYDYRQEKLLAEL